MINFKGYRFEKDIILLFVRWYLAYLLNMPVAQWIHRVPTNAHQDYVYRKAHSFCIEHVELHLLLKGA